MQSNSKFVSGIEKGNEQANAEPPKLKSSKRGNDEKVLQRKKMILDLFSDIVGDSVDTSSNGSKKHKNKKTKIS